MPKKVGKRGGDVLGIIHGRVFTEGALNRFWGNIDSSGGTEACWPWKACLDKDGYGKFSFGTTRSGEKSGQLYLRSHRFMLFLVTGEEGEVVMHKCDNEICCNPNHLKWGTVLENRAECVKKERQARGESSGNSVLNEELVRKIRGQAGTGTTKEIATRLGLTVNQVYGVLKVGHWSHVK